MPLAEFVEETWGALNKGNDYDEYPIGTSAFFYSSVELPRKDMMKHLPQTPAQV